MGRCAAEGRGAQVWRLDAHTGRLGALEKGCKRGTGALFLFNASESGAEVAYKVGVDAEGGRNVRYEVAEDTRLRFPGDLAGWRETGLEEGEKAGVEGKDTIKVGKNRAQRVRRQGRGVRVLGKRQGRPGLMSKNGLGHGAEAATGVVRQRSWRRKR